MTRTSLRDRKKPKAACFTSSRPVNEGRLDDGSMTGAASSLASTVRREKDLVTRLRVRNISRGIPATIAIWVAIILISAPAVADPLDDGLDALKRGQYALAMRLLGPLAEQGQATAQFSVGLMCHDGLGLSQNYLEAAKWYQRAAEQGDRFAQYNLGIMCQTGQRIHKDSSAASRWRLQSAKQGLAEAHYRLGLIYRDGDGVPLDFIQAYMWSSLAVSNLPTQKERYRVGAARNRDWLASKLNSGEIAKAQEMAARCLQTNYKECGLQIQATRPLPEPQDHRPAPTSTPGAIAASGTGFFVSESGHIVTNAHVVDGCSTVRYPGGGLLRKIAISEDLDLALLSASKRPEAIALIRGGQGPRVGESDVAVGFPLHGLLGSGLVVTTGTISTLSGLGNDSKQMQISAPVQPGNSGGPLLGENGSVVGVVFGKIDALKLVRATGDIPQNINFAIGLSAIQSFLNANKILYSLDESKATKSVSDIAAEASRYTIMIECLK